jgi:enoyl-CoA hydratase/carnithine racemase
MSNAATVGTIGVSIVGGVASVVIDNPAQRNAFTRAMCLELQELMPRLDADAAVAVVTLRGAGTTFSAGANINEMSSVLLDVQDDGTRVDQLSRADSAIASLSKPTVALVDGACMGGGWQIASACDFILASVRSVFAVTPAKLGLVYPRPGIERLVRQVGPAVAKYILLTGESFSATRAEALGLVVEAVPDEKFDERSAFLVETLQNNSRFSIHHLKHLVDLTATDDSRLDEAWEEAWEAMAESPDMAIGTSAFLAHERPHFTWKPTGKSAGPL